MIYIYGDGSCSDTILSKKLLLKNNKCFIYYPINNNPEDIITYSKLLEKYNKPEFPLIIELKINEEKLRKEMVYEAREIKIGGYEDLKNYIKN